MKITLDSLQRATKRLTMENKQAEDDAKLEDLDYLFGNDVKADDSIETSSVANSLNGLKDLALSDKDEVGDDEKDLDDEDTVLDLGSEAEGVDEESDDEAPEVDDDGEPEADDDGVLDPEDDEPSPEELDDVEDDEDEEASEDEEELDDVEIADDPEDLEDEEPVDDEDIVDDEEPIDDEELDDEEPVDDEELEDDVEVEPSDDEEDVEAENPEDDGEEDFSVVSFKTDDEELLDLLNSDELDDVSISFGDDEEDVFSGDSFDDITVTAPVDDEDIDDEEEDEEPPSDYSIKPDDEEDPEDDEDVEVEPADDEEPPADVEVDPEDEELADDEPADVEVEPSTEEEPEIEVEIGDTVDNPAPAAPEEYEDEVDDEIEVDTDEEPSDGEEDEDVPFVDDEETVEVDENVLGDALKTIGQGIGGLLKILGKGALIVIAGLGGSFLFGLPGLIGAVAIAFGLMAKESDGEQPPATAAQVSAKKKGLIKQVIDVFKQNKGDLKALNARASKDKEFQKQMADAMRNGTLDDFIAKNSGEEEKVAERHGSSRARKMKDKYRGDRKRANRNYKESKLTKESFDDGPIPVCPDCWEALKADGCEEVDPPEDEIEGLDDGQCQQCGALLNGDAIWVQCPEVDEAHGSSRARKMKDKYRGDRKRSNRRYNEAEEDSVDLSKVTPDQIKELAAMPDDAKKELDNLDDDEKEEVIGMLGVGEDGVAEDSAAARSRRAYQKREDQIRQELKSKEKWWTKDAKDKQEKDLLDGESTKDIDTAKGLCEFVRECATYRKSKTLREAAHKFAQIVRESPAKAHVIVSALDRKFGNKPVKERAFCLEFCRAMKRR